MFEALSEKLTAALRKVSGQRQLSETNVESALKEVKLALLEADVNYKVVGAFLDTVQARAIGEEVPTSINAGQHFIKIVSDELAAVMGSEAQALQLEGAIPAVVMLVGLQGSGKTLTAGKLARWLKEEGRKPYLVPADVYRPAAIEQLVILAEQLSVPVYPSQADMGAVPIVQQAMTAARGAGADVVLIDTAGRLHIDEEMMAELERIKAAVHPGEILFVADGMTGQDAVNTARAFHERLALTGHILTKMDGDARGGAALSLRAVTQQPIKFMGVGEKLENLERFHPERIATRILGMGDLVGLIEKAQDTFDEKQALEMQRKLANAEFTLADFLEQIRAIRRMGPLQDLMEMIPGMGGMMKGGNMEDGQLVKVEAIISSMTPRERDNHNVINHSRQKRIAKGSGTRQSDVNRVLKQFGQMRKMMKKMTRMGDPGKAMQMAQSLFSGGGHPQGFAR